MKIEIYNCIHDSSFIVLITNFIVTFTIALLGIFAALRRMKINEAIKHKLEWNSNLKNDIAILICNLQAIVFITQRFNSKVKEGKLNSENWDSYVLENTDTEIKEATMAADRIEISLSHKNNNNNILLCELKKLGFVYKDFFNTKNDKKIQTYLEELKKLSIECINKSYDEIKKLKLCSFKINYN